METEIKGDYYKLAALTSDLRQALEATRQEPGLTLKDISNEIKKALGPEDSKILAENLQK